MKVRGLLAIAALAYAASVHAMATIEFLQLGASRQYEVMTPIMLGFLKAGYKNVPSNEFILAAEVKKLAYEKGYTFQNVEEVAKEAAIRLGMKRDY